MTLPFDRVDLIKHLFPLKIINTMIDKPNNHFVNMIFDFFFYRKALEKLNTSREKTVRRRSRTPESTAHAGLSQL